MSNAATKLTVLFLCISKVCGQQTFGSKSLLLYIKSSIEVLTDVLGPG
jgi:hypothetical protein